MRVIPTTSEQTNYTQRVTLDGVDYVLRLLLNQREDRWYLDVLDTDENMLAAGLKLVIGYPLNIWMISHGVGPGGVLTVYDTSGADEDPGANDLGTRCVLVYVDESEAFG